MMAFAKVRRYVVPAAVIALATADAVGYHFLNRKLNESVPLSRELADEAESSESVKPTFLISVESKPTSSSPIADEPGADEPRTSAPTATASVSIEPAAV